jgi:hypothetical protein
MCSFLKTKEENFLKFLNFTIFTVEEKNSILTVSIIWHKKNVYEIFKFNMVNSENLKEILKFKCDHYSKQRRKFSLKF